VVYGKERLRRENEIERWRRRLRSQSEN